MHEAKIKDPITGAQIVTAAVAGTKATAKFLGKYSDAGYASKVAKAQGGSYYLDFSGVSSECFGRHVVKGCTLVKMSPDLLDPAYTFSECI